MYEDVVGILGALSSLFVFGGFAVGIWITGKQSPLVAKIVVSLLLVAVGFGFAISFAPRDLARAVVRACHGRHGSQRNKLRRGCRRALSRELERLPLCGKCRTVLANAPRDRAPTAAAARSGRKTVTGRGVTKPSVLETPLPRGLMPSKTTKRGYGWKHREAGRPSLRGRSHVLAARA